MTAIRTARRTSLPALIVFGLVYIATLAIIFAPSGLQARHPAADAKSIQTKGATDVLLP